MEGQLNNRIPDSKEFLLEANWDYIRKQLEVTVDRAANLHVGELVNFGGKYYKVESILENKIDSFKVKYKIRGLRFELRHLHSLIK